MPVADVRVLVDQLKRAPLVLLASNHHLSGREGTHLQCSGMRARAAHLSCLQLDTDMLRIVQTMHSMWYQRDMLLRSLIIVAACMMLVGCGQNQTSTTSDTAGIKVSSQTQARTDADVPRSLSAIPDENAPAMSGTTVDDVDRVGGALSGVPGLRVTDDAPQPEVDEQLDTPAPLTVALLAKATPNGRVVNVPAATNEALPQVISVRRVALHMPPAKKSKKPGKQVGTATVMLYMDSEAASTAQAALEQLGARSGSMTSVGNVLIVFDDAFHATAARRVAATGLLVKRLSTAVSAARENAGTQQ